MTNAENMILLCQAESKLKDLPHLTFHLMVSVAGNKVLTYRLLLVSKPKIRQRDD